MGCVTTKESERPVDTHISKKEPRKLGSASSGSTKDEQIYGNFIANRQYKIIDKLGQGSFGSVYKIQDKTTGEFRAAKLVSLTILSDFFTGENQN